MRSHRLGLAASLAACLLAHDPALAPAAVGAPATPARPRLVYLSGGGLATLPQIQNRVAKLRTFYETGPQGFVADVTYYEPDASFTLPFTTVTYRWYSQAKRSEIANFLKLNEGPDLHLMMSSMGAGNFRDHILPTILSVFGSFQAGAVVALETMAPLGPPPGDTSGFTFEVYTSIETPYVGAFANTFRQLSGAGPLVPDNCPSSNCYFLTATEGVEVRNVLDLPNAMDLHGLGVSPSEDLGQNIPGSLIKSGKTSVLASLDTLQENQPNVPVPAEGGSGPSVGTGTSGGQVTGGSTGASGGGVGIESHPRWLRYEDYVRSRLPPRAHPQGEVRR